MYWEGALIAVVLILTLYILYTLISRPKNFPPGPFPLPVIGSLHKLGHKPHTTFKELSRKYGDVFSMYLGNFPVVVVNSYEAAKEVLIKKGTHFAGRPDTVTGALAAKGPQDIAYDDYGPRWRNSRKLAHRALRLYGAGRLCAEKIITKQSQELLKRLETRVDGPFNPHEDFDRYASKVEQKANTNRSDLGLTGRCVQWNISRRAVTKGTVVVKPALAPTNVICAIVFGASYNIQDEEFRTILYYNKLAFVGLAGSSAVDFMPWLRFFPNKHIGMIKASADLRDPILEKWLNHHRQTFTKGQSRDLTDALIQGANEELLTCQNGQRYLTDDAILMIMSDIFSAGMESITNTLRWAVVYFVHWPEVQQRVQEELDSVIGRERLTTLQDIESLPYMKATIHEIGRLASVLPLLVPHKTTCNTSVSGYSVPKNTHVFVNAYAIHHDEREWEKPEEFCPERWLDENGHFIPDKNKAYFPFSAGPRVCFGEALAKSELFLFLSHVLQRFSVERAPGKELPKLEGHFGLTHEPFPHVINIRKRL